MDVSGDDLYVGGFFTQAGGAPANRIARYDATNSSWHALGDGVNNGVYSIGFSGDYVYVVGQFTESGGASANGAARFDVSSDNWHTLGDGVNGTGQAIALSGDDVYIGGSFTEAGSEPARNLAKFDSQIATWQPMADGEGLNALIWSIAINGDVSAGSIARYNLADGMWEALGDGVNNWVYSMVIKDEDVYVAGEFGLAGGKPAAFFAKWNGSGSVSIDESGEMPQTVMLDQNYPNPFNPTTQIQYALPEPAEVRLDVFNAMGQRITTLVNSRQGTGYHTVRFDASELSSGMYIYRLQAGNMVETKKMMLVK